ncbi:hypothetical protein FB45DRAFT_930943 [Roridomyces roridus]|uniref:Uncharacterized protein n=1 Tax=Roridomyces roridus TaxID=1738132 RepID=A0AAD7BF67_9AGAR|nr:hypothetical protein FB45DRAFT_930943 [Roridomyces roridus]
MASQFFNNPATFSQLPSHLACFGSSNSSDVCQAPSDAMLSFLNLTTVDSYLDAYCDRPPYDSCAFGYCPNPDVASPAVRYSTYFTSVVSAILTLYSPEEVTSAFFAQLLNVYSLIVAAIIAIAGHTLTKMHGVFALTIAASPLSIYLIFYVIRESFGGQTRLKAVFGTGQYLHRALVLLMVPLWISVLVFTTLPAASWHFQQAACNKVIAEGHIIRFFFLPFVSLVEIPEIGASILGSFVLAWGFAIIRLRKIIWAKKGRIFPFGRLWRKVVERYPLIQFYTVIVLPFSFWMFNTEFGIRRLSPRESFEATYGQLLAIFVTVPPFISLCYLLPGLGRWFADLMWVRLLTGRRNKPYLQKRTRQESMLSFQEDSRALLGEKGSRGSSLA